MASAAPAKPMTAEEFMNTDLGVGAHELFRGEVISSPPRRPSRTLTIAGIARPLEGYGRRSRLGYVLPLFPVVTERHPDTVREPDLVFYREDRWPRSMVGVSFPPCPPDVVIEIDCPSRPRGQVFGKLAEYMRIPIRSAWIVYPKDHAVAIYRADDEPPLVLRESDRIENLPELPGFSCLVADLFG